MLVFLGACQSKKELSLNNYKKYISVNYDATFNAENGHLIIVDLIVIKKVNKEDKLFDVTIKCSYVINDYEGEFLENLGDLNSTYRKEIMIPDNPEKKSSHSGQVTVLEISGTAQRGINADGMSLKLATGAFCLTVFAILGLFVARGLKFSANFDKIQIGMSYNEVVEILDEPSSSNKVDNILTCVWRKYVLRNWIIVRVVTFKDDTVISKTK